MPLNRHFASMKKIGLPFFALFLAVPFASAQSSDFMTKSETTLGVTLTSYKYDEPTYMSLTAALAGLELSQTLSLGNQWPYIDQSWFLKGDLKYAVGKADYQGISGTIKDTPNWYVEARALVGKDFDMGGHVLAPFVGLGFRYLHNDLRTDDARQGYRRDNAYTYVPMGVKHTMKLSNQAALSNTVEYLHLIKGVQKASLSDENPNRQNVRLVQPKGYGLRWGAMMRFDDWSIGPTLSYWKIDDSEMKEVFEPQNTTYEVGFKLMKHF